MIHNTFILPCSTPCSITISNGYRSGKNSLDPEQCRNKIVKFILFPQGTHLTVLSEFDMVLMMKPHAITKNIPTCQLKGAKRMVAGVYGLLFLEFKKKASVLFSLPPSLPQILPPHWLSPLLLSSPVCSVHPVQAYLPNLLMQGLFPTNKTGFSQIDMIMTSLKMHSHTHTHTYTRSTNAYMHTQATCIHTLIHPQTHTDMHTHPARESISIFLSPVIVCLARLR